MKDHADIQSYPSADLRLTFILVQSAHSDLSHALAGSTRCECTCDSELEPYVRRCNSSAGTLLRESNFWLTYVNESNSTGYLKYPYCPLDYCHPASSLVEVNLNIPGGSDAQCAFNQTGLLCGSCKPGLSLSLGSSLCLVCEENCPLNFVLITLAGLTASIVVKTIILVLNLTVAAGLINAAIFYANVLASSYSTFLSSRQQTSSVASGIVAFFNLDVTFNACYYNKVLVSQARLLNHKSI